MTDQLPAPLVPAEVDLRDFAFMPLDVSRLRDSDLASDETPEACWAAVLLWCASWHQIPAASIPDSDQWQAKQCGYVAQGRIATAWRKVKVGALRGWIKCDDGRLYHPVVAEKALDAWRSKLQQRWRTEVSRIKKHNQRHEMSLPLPEFDAWMSAGCPQGQALPVPEDKQQMSQGQGQSVPGETGSKRQGEGQGQGQGQGRIREGESAKPERAASASPSPTKGSRLPKDWQPAPEQQVFAESLGIRSGVAAAELAKFRDYWSAQPGQKGVKADWTATWRNWLRRVAEDTKAKPDRIAQNNADVVRRFAERTGT